MRALKSAPEDLVSLSYLSLVILVLERELALALIVTTNETITSLIQRISLFFFIIKTVGA